MRQGLRGVGIGLICLFAKVSVAWAACSAERVSLRGDFGQVQFNVEIADDPMERSQGLMFRESLPQSSGMLFVYERPQRVSFWMKNTLIPLDMIFMDATGTVQSVAHEAVPGDLTPIHGGDGILVVLEINGGLARRLGIDAGDQMQHAVFDPAVAAWPCLGFSK